MRDFSGFDDWIEVFSGGRRTDSSGNAREWSAADVQQMVDNHQPAPIVVGHPKDNAPAFGWTSQLKRDGVRLLAKFRDVYPAFAEAVKSQLYPNRSIRVEQTDSGWTLAHVGFLGAAAPAIPGLEAIKFSTPVGEFHDYSEVLGMADESKTTTPADAGGNRQEAQFTQDDLKRAADLAVQRMKAQHEKMETDFKAKLAEMQAVLELERDTRRMTEFTAWTKEHSVLEKGGARFVRLTPAQREGMAEFMSAISSPREFEFAAGDGKKKKTPLAFFQDFVASLPGQVRLGGDADGAPAEQSDDPVALAQKAREYISEMAGKGISITADQAVAHVTNGSK